MVQQLKVLSFKSDNWSTISQTQVVKGKNQFSKVIFWFQNTASSTSTNTYTAYTLNIEDINNCWLQYRRFTKFSQYVQHKYNKDSNHFEKLKVLTLLNNQPQSLLPKNTYQITPKFSSLTQPLSPNNHYTSYLSGDEHPYTWNFTESIL